MISNQKEAFMLIYRSIQSSSNKPRTWAFSRFIQKQLFTLFRRHRSEPNTFFLSVLSATLLSFATFSASHASPPRAGSANLELPKDSESQTISESPSASSPKTGLEKAPHTPPQVRPEWLKSPAAKEMILQKQLSWQWKYRWLIRGGVLAATYGIVAGIGRSAWEWGSGRDFLWKHDGWFEKDETLDGGSDKFGHLYGMYLLSRGITYIFDETMSPRWISILMGGLNSAAIGVIIEVGDAYTARYGFSYTDVVFNLIGTALAVVQDTFPIMDGLFSLSMWWFPSKGYINESGNKQELFTDYTGTKYFFHILLSGIPYIKDTPLRYFRLDAAFWSRGFKPYDYGYPDEMSQHLYFGISLDFAQIVLDTFPKKWYRTSTATFLKYYNLYGPFETGYTIDF